MWTFPGVFLNHGAKSVWEVTDLPGRFKIAAAREALDPTRNLWHHPHVLSLLPSDAKEEYGDQKQY